MTRTKSFRALSLLLAVLMIVSVLSIGTNANAGLISDLFKEDSKVVLKDGEFSITYNKDASVMKSEIVNGLVDFEASTLPEGVTVDDFTVEYKFTAINALVEATGANSSLVNGALSSLGFDAAGFPVNVQGWELNGVITGTNLLSIPQLQAGENQTIYVSYNGNDEYKASDRASAVITVEKASVKVSIKSGAIYPDEAIPENFVTTDPEDDFTIWTMYAGLNTSLESAIYIQLPQTTAMQLALGLIDPAYKLIDSEGRTFTGRLQDGMTIGEFREMMNQVIDIVQKIASNPVNKLVLDAVGFDLDGINSLVDALQNFKLFDNTRIALGTPNKAGIYTVVAVATNKNYNPGIGVGVLLVKMRILGVSLQWNTSLNSSLTAAQAASADLGATAYYDGKAVKQTVKSSFIGIKNAGGLYIGSDAPTEPGKYLQTAYTLGGNYLTLPLTRSFTISE